MSTPDLTQYTGDLATNTTYQLEMKVVGWVEAGTGSFSSLSDDSLAFSGSFDKGGHSGTVQLSLTVSGDNSGTVTAVVTDNNETKINLQDQACTFSEDDGTLTISPSDSDNTLEAKSYEGGMELWGSGFSHTVWIGADS